MRFCTGLLAVFVAVFAFATNAHAAEGEISFIGSEYELFTAVNEPDAINGLAISINFYKGTSAENQKAIDTLVEHVVSRELRPVFLYGQPYDSELSKKFLRGVDGSSCRPTLWAGIFPADGEPAAGRMCLSGVDGQQYDESWLRDDILANWPRSKKYFLENRNKR